MFRILDQQSTAKPTLGECFLNGGFPVEALPYLEAEVQERPKNWGAWNNLGCCHKFLGHYEMAIECLKRSMMLSPNAVQPCHNLGMAYEESGHLKEAIQCYVHAVSFHRNEQSEYGLAECLFRDGKFDMGVEMWERSRLEKNSCAFIPNIKVWRGEDLEGKKILVTREGGHGDVFWLLRYVKPLKDMGAHVTFHAYESQRSLLEGHPWIDRWADQSTDLDEKDFDYQVPLWSIMWEMRKLEPQNGWVPMGMDEPYITVPAPEKSPHGFTVGICWKAGECLSVWRKLRSIQDEWLAAFADIPVDWVSLIPGEKPDWCNSGLPEKCDWKTTAEVVAGLDLVISADTSMCHLAGAMGKPAWVFVPLASDWKWFHDKETSSWYPGMRIFRNTDAVSFKPVVDEMVSELWRVAEAKAGVPCR